MTDLVEEKLTIVVTQIYIETGAICNTCKSPIIALKRVVKRVNSVILHWYTVNNGTLLWLIFLTTLLVVPWFEASLNFIVHDNYRTTTKSLISVAFVTSSVLTEETKEEPRCHFNMHFFFGKHVTSELITLSSNTLILSSKLTTLSIHAEVASVIECLVRRTLCFSLLWRMCTKAIQMFYAKVNIFQPHWANILLTSIDLYV